MIFQPKLFYRTFKDSWLYKSDRDNVFAPFGSDLMTEVPAKSMVMFAKKGRLRFIRVIFKDLTGYIWMPLNVPTHLFMDLVNMNEEQSSPEAPNV